MSETRSEPGDKQPDRDTPGSRLRTMHWGYAVVPAATFAVGLVIGVLVTTVGGDDGGGPTATATVSVTPSTTESVDTEVRVPEECVRAAETAQEATQLILDNLSSLQDFNGQRIIDMLDELEQLSRESNELAQSCSDVEVSPAEDASPTP